MTPSTIFINRDNVQATHTLTATREKTSTAMSATNNDHAVNGHAPVVVHSAKDRFGQLQATMRTLFEAQQAVLERYLVTQERILRYCMPSARADTDGVVSVAPLPVSAVPAVTVPVPPSAAETAPATLGTSAPSSVSRLEPAPASGRPPIPMNAPPISPRWIVSAPVPPERRSSVSVSAHTTNGSVPNSAPDGDGPPSTEQFRQDLLAVVSMRTGYPIDALNETLALEAPLGIDSIKTVEIFSKLKAYHLYFRAEGQEEEDLLVDFSKFKTLRDIITSYDQRRKAHVAAQVSNGTGKPTAENVNGSQKTNGSVQRYTLAAVPAPLEINNAKKFPDNCLVLVIGDVPEVTGGIVAALTSKGYRVRQALPGQTVRRLQADRYEADLSSPQALQELHRLVVGPDGDTVGLLINFLGLCRGFGRLSGEQKENAVTIAEWTFHLVKEFAEDLRSSAAAGGGWFVNLTALDGQFGLKGGPGPFGSDGTLGISKTLQREYPRLRVKTAGRPLLLHHGLPLSGRRTVPFRHAAHERRSAAPRLADGPADVSRWGAHLRSGWWRPHGRSYDDAAE
ncbi:MAG: hypothetical protein ACRELG_21265 [Gemmataceae bacterium]